MNESQKTSIPLSVKAGLAVTVLLLLTGGAWFFRSQQDRQRREVEARLLSIARLKVGQIADWRAERLADAAVLVRRRALLASAERFLAAPSGREKAEMLHRFRILKQRYDFFDILLLDSKGRVRLDLKPQTPELLGKCESSINDAIAKKKPSWTPLHVGPAYPFPHLSMVAPLFAPGKPDRPVGTVVLVCDVTDFLYPLIQTWPTPSETAETLLVRKDGDDVLFLNELRHRKDTALKFRIPLSRTDLPAAMAIEGREGIVEGFDYRGVKVLAAILHVPDSPWYMVSKVDSAEAFADWRFRAAMILLFIFTVLGLVAISGLVFRQRYLKAHYRELYRAEADLRRALERHRITLQSIGDAVIATDEKGRVELLNPTAESLTGWKQEEAQGRPLADVFHILNEETGKQVEDPASRVLTEGALLGLANHTLLISRNGKKIPIADSAAPILDESRKTIGVVLVFQDQTKERQYRKAVVESEKKYRLLAENSLDVIWTMNRDLEFTYANPAVSTLLGRLPEDVLGSRLADHCDEQNYAKIAGAITGESADSGFIVEAEMRKKSGEPIPVEIHGKTIRDDGGEVAQVRGSIQDITERKLAEQQILHLNNVLRAIRDVNQLIVHERDRDRLIREGCRLLVDNRGYSSALIVLTDENDRPTSWAEAGLDSNADRLTPLLEGGRLPPCCESLSPDEEFKVMEGKDALCSACPIADAHSAMDAMCVRLAHRGGLFGYLIVSLQTGLLSDTDEKALFSEMAGDLAYALSFIQKDEDREESEKRRLALEGQLLQAQKMEAVGRLAGGIAHDYNNMLTLIIGYAETALENIAPSGHLRTELQEIHKAGMRSADITRQLLAFARQQTISPKVLDINDTVEGMLKMLHRLIGEDIDLVWSPGHPLWPVKMDPAQVDQLLANLCVNARDAIDDVGRITIETGTVVFDEAYCAVHPGFLPGEFVMLAVSDDGSGMDAETREMIFEPFFSTKGSGEGTGLGLSTVYGIVKQNDGFINVYSEPGKGTTFKIYLRRHAGRAEDPHRSDSAQVQKGRGETVLVVEDETPILKLAQKILTESGYAVMTAASPGEAKKVAQNFEGQIDLLVTDVVMPGMNGRELAGELSRICPDLKILYMSGYTTNVIAHRGILEEGVWFLQKPFSKKELSAKVREALNGD